MVERITEKKLGDFQEFERWLDEKRLLDSEVLYRGHADSAWSLERWTPKFGQVATVDSDLRMERSESCSNGKNTPLS